MTSPDRETEIRQAIVNEYGYEVDQDVVPMLDAGVIVAAARESALLAELDAAKQWAAERERVIDTLREERERWEQRAHECNTERAKANGERDALQARIDAVLALCDAISRISPSPDMESVIGRIRAAALEHAPGDAGGEQ